MNPWKVAEELIKEIDMVGEQDPDGMSTKHAVWMLEQIYSGELDDLKEMRWLGYAQAILVIDAMYTLEQMKEINKRN
jgi:hypothetical protein